MSAKLRAAIIGCGRPYTHKERTGSGMAHLHASGYTSREDVELAALCDIKPENAQAFAEQHCPNAAIYTDMKKMLKQEQPDLVSVCLWPHLHATAVIACAKAGVKAVHSEKPMAPTWGEALKMAAECEKSGTQLTFNHQRRFLAPFRKARELAREGAIGRLVRLEGSCSNMIDWGTHWLDMFFFMNEETPAVWVLGQIDAREFHQVFGLPYEHQAICEIKFENGVRGVLFTGEDSDIGCQIRLIGEEGVIELRNDDPPLWVRAGGAKWKTPKVTESLHGGHAVGMAIWDMIDALKGGYEPELSARKALQATEVIFATYESSRKRGRVDLPLKAKDSAFLSMLESGDLKPKKPAKK
ncbi:MAG: Gfo/Idh/MocA family oxidoreductase [Acidobacteriota bacterium]|jgi:predicted dehydrogenase|nr:Gfo/Idh/MocA family oxidoreductase [Acidobacteriota bacterium]